MRRLLLRYVVLIALMFWQGGFTFYAAVVVPVGTAVLNNSALRQGFITREVTGWLNVTAAVALSILGIELICTRDRSRVRTVTRAGLWVTMAACQGLLFWLHPYLANLLERRGLIVLDPEAFRPAHRLYLWTHTVQWGVGLVFVALMLIAWRREDRDEERGAQKSSAVDRLGVAQSPTQPQRNVGI